jgi:hypothetical protein
MTGFRAFCRGGLIAVLSFFSLMLVLSLVFARVNSLEFFRLFLFLSAYGLLLAGWETIIIGGLAGLLLYKRYS